MSDLEDPNASQSPLPGGNPVLNSVSRTLAAPQVGALLTLAMALTLGVGLIMWALRPEFVPITEQQSRQDALQIMEMLNTSATPYKLDPNTGLVLVPKAQAAEIKLGLAASGLLQRESVGLEVLQQESSLGTSHFTETARYQHALETELSRTISSMRNVESARVHLALPKQSVFVRDREQASASVMIKPLAGRVIEEEQVNAVTNLVASSIPYLQSDQVTIVDQWGRLLSTGDETGSGINRDQYQYTRRLEKLYSDRIVSLLTPVVGAGRVRAIVTAEVDFSINERTEENYNPDPLQLRSAESQLQRRTGAAAAGVPGALTNQPPEAGTIAEGVPGQEGGAETVNETSSELKNYELDKTITHTRQSPGGVRRLTAAVIIDDQITTNEAGEIVRTPLGDEALAEYTALAREAIGFDENRGDSVVLFNRPFQPAEEILPMEPLPIWQQPWLWTMVRQVMIGLSVLLLILLVVRPAFKKLVAEDDGQDLLANDAVDGDTEHDPKTTASTNNSLDDEASLATASLDAPPAVYGDILNMARVMAAEDPKRVAKVVKDWVKETS